MSRTFVHITVTALTLLFSSSWPSISKAQNCPKCDDPSSGATNYVFIIGTTDSTDRRRCIASTLVLVSPPNMTDVDWQAREIQCLWTMNNIADSTKNGPWRISTLSGMALTACRDNMTVKLAPAITLWSKESESQQWRVDVKLGGAHIYTTMNRKIYWLGLHGDRIILQNSPFLWCIDKHWRIPR